MAFHPTKPRHWWHGRGCLLTLVAAVAITCGVLGGVVIGQQVVDEWDTQAQEQEK